MFNIILTWLELQVNLPNFQMSPKEKVMGVQLEGLLDKDLIGPKGNQNVIEM